jgi:hypothetical protein
VTLNEAFDLTSDLAANKEKVTLEEANRLIKSSKVRNRQGGTWYIQALQIIIDDLEQTKPIEDIPDIPLLDQMCLMLEDIEDNVRILKDMIKQLKEGRD